jgi:hypothetical protein
MAASIYAPLQNDDSEFRLLILQPSTDRSAPLRCDLNRASFVNEGHPPMYTALSYTWGDPLATTPILVNGIETHITLNLEAALQHIRQPSDEIVLWIDALCINQDDLAEKNHQVEMMREIYSGAEVVIAWLGVAGDDSNIAMEVLGQGLEAWIDVEKIEYNSDEEDWSTDSDSWVSSDDQGSNTPSVFQQQDTTTASAQRGPQLPSPPTAGESRNMDNLSDSGDEDRDGHRITDQLTGSASSEGASFSSRDSASTRDVRSVRWEDVAVTNELFREFFAAFKQFTAREVLAMRALLTRSWWSRIWVIQEVLLAKRVIFKCGDAEVSGERMRSWRGDALIVLEAVCDASYSTNHIFPALALLGSMRSPIERDDLIEYLVWYGMHEATRPHDYFYGILGIVPEDHRLVVGPPDYGCRAEDLFTRVATRLMVDQNSLRLLIAAGMSAPPTATSSAAGLKLPSWVPDWTRRFLHYSTQTGMGEDLRSFSELVFHFSDDLTELTFIGFRFDMIESVQSVPARSQGKMPLWQGVPVTDQRARDGGGPQRLEELITVLLGLGDDRLSILEGSRFSMIAAFFQELDECRISRRRSEAGNGDSEDSDYLSGLLDWTGETRDGRTDEEILQKVFNEEDARSFLTWYHEQSTADLQSYYIEDYSLSRTGPMGTAGCSIFRTSKGSFALSHAAVAPGDILCVVPSCTLALVLRKASSSRYVLVGPVRGLVETLNGDLAQAIERGEISKESFTLV